MIRMSWNVSMQRENVECTVENWTMVLYYQQEIFNWFGVSIKHLFVNSRLIRNTLY